MIIVPLIPFLRRRRIVSAPTPPAPSITVVSVTADGSAYGAVWEFSDEITLLGANVPELEIDGEDEGFVGPDDVLQVGPTKLEAHYFSSSGIELGNAWRVIVQPSPAQLAPPLVIPQSGVVE